MRLYHLYIVTCVVSCLTLLGACHGQVSLDVLASSLVAQNQGESSVPQSPESSKSSDKGGLSPLYLTLIATGGIVGIALILFFGVRSPQKNQTPQLQDINFTTITLDKQGQIQQKRELVAKYIRENLGSDVTLDLIYLSGGIFTMGSRAGEGDEREKPRREVFVKPFLIGKYPITQAQWGFVASLPKIRQDIDPDPSKFKGDNRPVENITWYDAVEFCQRLSQFTGREYRLPSEAEWEYACRGNAKTPFYFGETITTDVANYKGIFTYANENKGIDRHETTPVDQFPPNAFGLYDLHGNVGEFCADTWHDNYQDAPVEGVAWIKNSNEEYRVRSPVRGGAWIGAPNDCRCASRKSEIRDRPRTHNGLRVVCEVTSFNLV